MRGRNIPLFWGRPEGGLIFRNAVITYILAFYGQPWNCLRCCWVCHLANVLPAQSLSHVWLCDPMDCSLPGSSVHGILQARILEWVAVPFSRASSQPRGWAHVSCIGRQILYHLNHLGSLMFHNEHIMRLRVYWKSIFHHLWSSWF